MSSSSSSTRSFKAVFIPAAASESVSEWVIDYTSETEVGCLIERLKQYFALKQTGPDRESAREAIRQQIREAAKQQSQGKTDQIPDIDDELLDRIMQMSAVDCVPLQNNKKSTGFVGLMMYVDDQGKAKNLAVNQRATLVTMECGNPTQVLGDVLIARNFDNDDSFERRDFTLEEFNNDKKWKEDALRANKEKDPANVQKMQDMLKTLRASGTKIVDSSVKGVIPTHHLCAYPGCPNRGASRCSRCKKVHYCSVECQKKHWKSHKPECSSS